MQNTVFKSFEPVKTVLMASKFTFDFKPIHLLALEFTPAYLSVLGKEFDSKFYRILSQYHKIVKSGSLI